MDHIQVGGPGREGFLDTHVGVCTYAPCIFLSEMLAEHQPSKAS